MTTSAPIDFGRDILCDPITEDADAFMTEVTGVPLVRQDLRHRLTVDSVLGPEGSDTSGFFDIRKLAGADAGTAANYTARIKRVCLRDQRIKTAAVRITETTAGGLRTITIDIQCTTALGPFRLVFLLDPNKPIADLLTLILDQ